jgi:hypothetical protein
MKVDVSVDFVFRGLDSRSESRAATQHASHAITAQLLRLRRAGNGALDQRGDVFLVARQRVIAFATGWDNWKIFGIRLIQENSGWNVISRFCEHRIAVSTTVKKAIIGKIVQLFHVDLLVRTHYAAGRAPHQA